MDPFALLRGGANFAARRKAAKIASSDERKNTNAQASIINGSSLDFFGDSTRNAASTSVEDVSGNVMEEHTPPISEGKRPTINKKSKKKSRRSTADVEDENPSADALQTATVEELSLFKKALRISTKGTDVPPPVQQFNDLTARGVSSVLISSILRLGFDTPSPIQAQAIPSMLAGRDTLAVAPTGSGKTLAFAIPVLAALGKPAAVGFRACIVSPTRELANQIKREFDLVGGATKLNIRLLDKSTSSANSFGKGSSMKFDILISTPLRLVHALQQESLSLAAVEWLVLDEADRLMENGFDEQIDEVFGACSKPERRVALFSATMPQRVEELVRSVLVDPVNVRIGAQNAAATTVDQTLLFVSSEHGKLVAMRQLVQEGLKPPVLIFVQSKARAKELFHELVYDGINVDVIHADRTKQQRDDVVRQFRSGRVWVLIATDLMARGVDFKGVNMVINYDFPGNSVDYIHRVGRTGRAGRVGRAVTFFTEADGGSIANVIKASGGDIPDWMLAIKNKRKGRSRVINRPSISTDAPKESGIDGSTSKKTSRRKRKAASQATD